MTFNQSTSNLKLDVGCYGVQISQLPRGEVPTAYTYNVMYVSLYLLLEEEEGNLMWTVR